MNTNVQLNITDDECQLKSLFDMITRFDERLTNHMAEEFQQDQQIVQALLRLEKRLTEIESKVDSLMVLQSAFPTNEDGDLDLHGHKHDHTSRMKAYRDSHNFWNRMKDEAMANTVKAVMLAAVVIFSLGIHAWFSSWIGIK